MHVTLFTVLQSSAPVNDRIISATSDTASTTLPVVQIYASTYWLQGETGATTEAFIDSFPAAAAPWQHPIGLPGPVTNRGQRLLQLCATNSFGFTCTRMYIMVHDALVLEQHPVCLKSHHDTSSNLVFSAHPCSLRQVSLCIRL